MRFRTTILCFSLACLLSPGLHAQYGGMQYTPAQYDKYRFSRLDISQGLSHNEVTCIRKDQRGFLWFGTMSGLNRYDVYTFKVFRHDPRAAAREQTLRGAALVRSY